MKTKMKNLITITSIIVFSMIAIASSEDNSNVNNEEATEENPMDNIDDSGDDGSYDYTEDLGDGWTLYHAYKPSQSSSDCNSKKCNWCNDNYYADDVDFDEYPSNLYEAIGNAGGLGSKDNIDMENKRIYSSWTVKCIYNYGDYCSRRCSEKY